MVYYQDVIVVYSSNTGDPLSPSFALKFRPFDKVERSFDTVAQNGKHCRSNMQQSCLLLRQCCFDIVASVDRALGVCSRPQPPPFTKWFGCPSFRLASQLSRIKPAREPADMISHTIKNKLHSCWQLRCRSLI